MTKRVSGLMMLAGFLLLLIGCSSSAPSKETDFKVVVLGFDGVDPDLVRDWIDQLPNIQDMSQAGTFSDLGTTNPPESPVAWASFSTGMNPGKHGIFDFLKRDPETYFPDIGLVSREKPEFLFGTIPYKAPVVTNLRKGTPFWKVLDENGIKTVNLRMPLEFPPIELDHGKTSSGLGFPDVRATWGTYFYLASDLTQWDVNDTEFGGRQIQLLFEDNKAPFALDGPVDPRNDEFVRIEVPGEVELHDDNTVTIRIQGKEERIGESKWSDWFEIEFPIGPFVSVYGVSRFYVLETYPEVRLYLMPISIDPRSPPLPFTTPDDYNEDLVERYGIFKTLGWIHETWGLNEEQIDEAVFLEDLYRNMDALEKNLLDELDQGEASLYTTVFTATDSVGHLFYRLLDPLHPRYDSRLAEKYGDSILNVYKRMDSIVGNVRKRLGEKDLLLVVSDHGFHSWRKEFNTNTWLVRNGFMTLEGMDADPELRKLDLMFSGGSFFQNVDWSRTKAYALGLGQIYINLKGREKLGIVEPGAEYDQLVSDIREQIVQFIDPDNGEHVLENAYYRGDIYQGGEVDHAGDIVVAFRNGYRTSWQTSLGAVPEDILVANLKKWSGDHCASDITQTSGFLVSNRAVTSDHPSVIDVAPTLYRLFGVDVPAQVDGKPWSFGNGY